MIAGVALSAVAAPAFRFGNVALGIWLIGPASLARANAATVWNNVIVGVVVALVGTSHGELTGRHARVPS